MTHHPPILPPIEQWPLILPPDCPHCGRPDDVDWTRTTPAPPGEFGDAAQVNRWQCRACRAEWAIPVTRWPVLDGPDCPTCLTPVTYWAALAPDHYGDLWVCRYGHEFVLTPDGLIFLPWETA